MAGAAGWPAAFTITLTNTNTASIVSHLLVPFDSRMSRERYLHRPCAVVRVSVLCVSEPDLVHTDRRKERTAIGHGHHGGSCDEFPERYKSLDNVRTAKLEGVRRKDRRRRKIRSVRLCTSNQPSLPGLFGEEPTTAAWLRPQRSQLLASSATRAHGLSTSVVPSSGQLTSAYLSNRPVGVSTYCHHITSHLFHCDH